MRPGKEMVSEPARPLQELATPAVPTQAVPQPGGKDMELQVVEGLKKWTTCGRAAPSPRESSNGRKEELLGKLHEQ
jgi:hypothetical protein